jgi:hypothetical protein
MTHTPLNIEGCYFGGWMDANIAYIKTASTWFKIFSALFLVAGVLITIVSHIPSVVGLFVAGAVLRSNDPALGLFTGLLGLVVGIIQILGVIFFTFVLYTVARVLELLADIGDEIYDLRRIRFESGHRPK